MDTLSSHKLGRFPDQGDRGSEGPETQWPPAAAGSGRPDRVAVGRGRGPAERGPAAQCDPPVYGEGRAPCCFQQPGRGGTCEQLLYFSDALSRGGPQSAGSSPDPAVASCGGPAAPEKPGVRVSRNPAAPRSSRTPFSGFGQGIAQVASFLSCPSARRPSEMVSRGIWLSVGRFEPSSMTPRVPWEGTGPVGL